MTRTNRIRISTGPNAIFSNAKIEIVTYDKDGNETGTVDISHNVRSVRWNAVAGKPNVVELSCYFPELNIEAKVIELLALNLDTATERKYTTEEPVDVTAAGDYYRKYWQPPQDTDGPSR